MTTLALEAPAAVAEPLFADDADRPSLDDLVSGAWEGLAARGAATCPVCEGEMAVRLPGELTGHCADCGASLV